MQPPDGTSDARPTGARTFSWRAWVRPAVCGLIAVTGIAVLAVAAWVSSIVDRTPGPEDLRAAQEVPRPSVVLSADGQVLATLRGVQQEAVTLSQVSPVVLQALVATEDHRFFEHRGVDTLRTVSALVHTAFGDTQGGSTITQQLARNLFPEHIGRARNIERKVKEMATAVRLEQLYSKNEILEAYLNTVPFLYNVVGIEMAARTYFAKSAATLDATEAAMLVGMLKGTHYYNPVRFPERALQRRNVVLGQMARHAVLPAHELQAAAARPLGLRFSRPSEEAGPAPHFTAQVRKWLADWADANGLDPHRDGLVVHTTLDTRLQALASQAVERQAQALQHVADVEWSRASASLLSESTEAYAKRRPSVTPFKHFWAERPQLLHAFVRETASFRKLRDEGVADAQALRRLLDDRDFVAALMEDKTRLEAGFVAVDPASGAVLAWVGSRDFAVDQFDHVGQALRQPGSTFKPLVYGAALAAGYTMDRTYVDEPLQVALRDGTVWEPTDMDGPSLRTMSMYEALVMSRNTVTARVMQEVGVPAIVNLARAAGITRSRLDAVPSLALGTSPVTLLEMANAYATIAALGERREPVLVSRIADRSGRVLAQFASAPQRAMSREVAQDLVDMLRGVVAQGTGAGIRHRFDIRADVAGKTGTSQYNADGWFMLAHPRLVAGAWVGFNDQRVTLRSSHWGQGGHNALLLVGDFFRAALKAKHVDAKAKFPPPRQPLPPIPTPQPLEEGWLFDAAAAGVVVTRDAQGRIVIGDRPGAEAMSRPYPNPFPETP
jgi:penicillin-binding protein 1A